MGYLGKGGPSGRLQCVPKYGTTRTSHSSQEVTSAEAQGLESSPYAGTQEAGNDIPEEGLGRDQVGGLLGCQIFTRPVGKSSKLHNRVVSGGQCLNTKHRPHYCEAN